MQDILWQFCQWDSGIPQANLTYDSMSYIYAAMLWGSKGPHGRIRTCDLRVSFPVL
jgi:hypothetical protein